MKIAMFGGSFNPPHMGHFLLAEKFIEELALDRLIIIPAFIPPHKLKSDMASAEHRLNMCRLLEKYDGKITASDIEIKRGGRSYTADTLREIKAEYPDSELYLIVGADMYMSLQSWHMPEEIFSLAAVCTVPRNSDDAAGLENHSRFLKRFGCTSVILRDKVMTVSSTQVRSAVKRGEFPDGLVLPEVYDYIRAHGLYV